jgi:pentatricopeptide repeat protein
VDIWGKAGNLEKACGWFNSMLDSGVRPNVPTCNSLLGAYLRENLHDNVRKLLYDMSSQGLVPSLQTYTLLLSSYTMSGRTPGDGESIWQIMASLGHPAHFFLCSLPGSTKKDTRERIIRFFEIISCNEEQESKRSFTDAAISFLHNVNMKAEAAVVWEVASEKQIYPKAVTQKAAKYWAINLHTMSMGTAIVALSRTLAHLKERMLATGVVPERIDIITGWWRRSRITGSSLIKQAIEEILKAVSSPFRVESRNSGCFVGIGHPLAVWLYESNMEQIHLI